MPLVFYLIKCSLPASPQCQKTKTKQIKARWQGTHNQYNTLSTVKQTASTMIEVSHTASHRTQWNVVFSTTIQKKVYTTMKLTVTLLLTCLSPNNGLLCEIASGAINACCVAVERRSRVCTLILTSLMTSWSFYRGSPEIRWISSNGKPHFKPDLALRWFARPGRILVVFLRPEFDQALVFAWNPLFIHVMRSQCRAAEVSEMCSWLSTVFKVEH